MGDLFTRALEAYAGWPFWAQVLTACGVIMLIGITLICCAVLWSNDPT